MDESLLWLLGVVAAGAFGAWCCRRRLTALLREPSPAVLRVCRMTGRVAGAVCGVACMVLVWAGATQPEVSWLYACLGVVVLALNLLLFIRPGRSR